MSVCYGCATSFGVFNKQLGCKNCGFAFCKKCLVKKTNVPKLNNEKAAVCNKCFDLLTGKIQPVTIEPPAAYSKRVLAASQTQQDHPSPRNAEVHCSKQTKGLSNEDAALARRLEDLKKDRKAGAPVPSQAEIESRMSKLREERKATVPSDREIAERLALVRGQDPSRAMQPSVLKPENRKMQHEQVDDLLSEICQEVEIDSHAFNHTRTGGEANDLNRTDLSPAVQGCAAHNIGTVATDAGRGAANKDAISSDVDRMVREVAAEMELDAKRAMEDLSKDKELWNRVQRLKADRKAMAGSDKNETKAEGYSGPESDEDNEEEATKRLIQQLLEKNRLEEDASKEPGLHSHDQRHSNSSKKKEPRDDSDMETDELQWCCICNNDAALRCKGCDGDLYCQRCYREGHDRYDREEHKTIPYKKK